ncbi:MAG: hypothetical protein J6A46_01300 [Clostridia bacterium]|nr:hypothetical protein [Clostridia bacterium]
MAKLGIIDAPSMLRHETAAVSNVAVRRFIVFFALSLPIPLLYHDKRKIARGEACSFSLFQKNIALF